MWTRSQTSSNDKRFGRLRFPDHREPPPGPLALLALQLCESNDERRFGATQRLLDDLPPELPTHELRSRHGALLDRIAATWHDGRALRRLFDDLMFDDGRSRRDLSFEAIVELTELKEYAMRVVHGERPSVWDEALGL
jgi:hypothetical protein